MIKTTITDLFDDLGVRYKVLPHAEPVFTVEAAARQRGVVLEEMVKSILLRDREGRYVMACVPGDRQLDTRSLRDALPGDWKRLSFATADEILAVTGCVQGAVAPVALPAEVPVIFDEAFGRCARVNISSGDPMAGLDLDARDLIRVTRARLAPIAAR